MCECEAEPVAADEGSVLNMCWQKHDQICSLGLGSFLEITSITLLQEFTGVRHVGRGPPHTPVSLETWRQETVSIKTFLKTALYTADESLNGLWNKEEVSVWKQKLLKPGQVAAEWPWNGSGLTTGWPLEVANLTEWRWGVKSHLDRSLGLFGSFFAALSACLQNTDVVCWLINKCIRFPRKPGEQI